MAAQQGTNEHSTEYVTVTIGEQLFGLPIARVQDVFVPEKLTRVHLAPPEVAGVLNLRGRIVTAIDMRRKLDLAPRADDKPVMAVGIDTRGESYGLLVDTVGEVLKFPASACEPKPANLDDRWARVASDVIRMDGQLLVVLDVDRVLDIRRAVAAA
jgi:purine-binding chemotaxis protein CheW